MATSIDILNRQPFVDRLIQLVRYLADNHRGCTFAIDGQWGSGKSFVLDMFEKQISLFQSPEAAGDRYILFHYNCWQYDFYEEPAIAIVTAMRDEILKYQRLFPNPPIEIKAALSLVSDLGKDLIENIIESKLGFSPFRAWGRYKTQKESYKNEIANANKFDSFFDFKIALDKTRDRLSKAAKEKPIIVVVDEIDRCIPEYAIKVLERLHHLFDNQENVIVILAVDGEQLNTAIENIYGISGENKVDQYLRKFISFAIHLDTGNISNDFFVKYGDFLRKFSMMEGDYSDLDRWIRIVFNDIDIRTQEKIMEYIMVLHNLSFDRVVGIYILYFELLSQFLSGEDIKRILTLCAAHPYVEKNVDSIYNIEISKTKFKNKGVSSKGIVSFLDYAQDTFRRQREVTLSGHVYRTMVERPQYIPFWIFDTINSDSTESQLCNIFYFENAPKYSEEVHAAHKFYELSKLITLSDFNGKL